MCTLTLALSACSGSDSEPGEQSEKPGSAKTPDDFTAVDSGSLSYATPEGWREDPEVLEGWTRYIGSHDSEPDVAAAEISDYQGPELEELTAEEAANYIGEEFPADEQVSVEDSSATSLPGAEEVYRINYEHEFRLPEFDRYHISDFGIKSEDGTVLAVRIGAVTEMVEDGTFQELEKTVRATPE